MSAAISARNGSTIFAAGARCFAIVVWGEVSSLPGRVPSLWRSPPNVVVASSALPRTFLLIWTCGASGRANRAMPAAIPIRAQRIEEWAGPPHPPLWALILGGVRRGAPCGGPKSALRTPPAVQSPGGVGGLRPLT